MMKRLAYLLLIAALAVVGISMSAHSASPAGHTATASSPASVHALEALHDHPTRSDSSAPVGHDAAPCIDCGDDHSGLLMACAFLALLLVVSVLLPMVAVRSGLGAPHAVLTSAVQGRTAPPRPPDLAKLCISRQ